MDEKGAVGSSSEQMSSLIPPDWPFADSPWDMLVDCHNLGLNLKSATYPQCAVATLLGAWSVFVFPIVFVLILLGTALCFIAFALTKKVERPGQAVYLYVLCATGLLTSMLFGMLWLFPAKGLPYATSGRVYYFVFYDSPTGCALYRFFYSFVATAGNNILVVATADRCLMLFFPVKFTNLSKRYTWYVSGITIAVSFLMMTPFLYFFQLISIDNKLTCTIPPGNIFFEVYHTLFSNAGIVQPILISIINVVFMFKLNRRTGRRVSTASAQSSAADDAIFWRYSVVLVIMSTVYVVSALAQAIAYLIAFTLAKLPNPVETQVKLAYNIADIGWHVYFLRVLMNLVLIARHFPACSRLVKRMFTRNYQQKKNDELS